MISTGIDIIALQYINSDRSKQERFFSKIICEQEIALYKSIDSTCIAFENLVWLAWSIKESIYKFYKRLHPEVLFSPTKINVQKIHVPINKFLLINTEHEAISFDDKTCFCCEVTFKNETFYTRSLVQDDLIFTVANNADNFKNIFWGIKTIDNDTYENQSQTVRDFVLNRMKIFFPGNELSIEKAEAGYPFLAQQKKVVISFAHQGNFVGYSFKLNNFYA